ncbi:hypothetical protein B0H15DRAFT_793063 [Mycena belliarum]|uniref:Uncharacterized protein n=1 Tax=Mycena belliarum TaxID=1033014 RepID=A0AAD6TN14_9AGAR|nr:hypothetical protein B0H15DRAFT_793063 [Mycena belliae]
MPPCPADAPQWVKAVYAEISGDSPGTTYNGLVGLWLSLEKLYGFSQGRSGGGLPKSSRPAALSAWITAGRGGRGGPLSKGVGPPIGPLAAYDETWWRWWGTLQPKWRKENGRRPGHFLRDTYPESASKNWTTLRHPGQNGVLSLVASLYWWGKKVIADGGLGDRESWLDAVADVKWMVKGLLLSEGGGREE